MIRGNFTAELHCQHGQIVVADTRYADHPFTSADEDGWLCTETSRTARNQSFKRTAFHFQHLKSADNREHYHITCPQHWDYAGSRLERNRNGWIGLYGTHVVGRIINAIDPSNLFRLGDYWKLEALQAWDGEVASLDQIDCYLRDHDGHRVSQCNYGLETLTLSMAPFLNAGAMKGEVLTFRLRNIKPD